MADKEVKIPGWAKKEKIKKIKDPDTGEKCLQLEQDLPSEVSIEARHIKPRSVEGRTVGRREWRDVRRNTKTLVKGQFVNQGEKIAIPSGNNGELFYEVEQSGFLTIRYADIITRRKTKRVVLIDSFDGAAILRPDPGMTREWKSKTVTVEDE